MPAGYMAMERIVLPTGLVEKGEKFGSDAVPGKFWKPIDKEAKAAVKARDEAAKAGVVVSADPRVAELEAALAAANSEAERLQAEVEALTAPVEVDADAAK